MGSRDVPVDQSNLLLRGSRLRNTKWVLGLVTYTGKESKIAQNARSAPSKQSNLDKVRSRRPRLGILHHGVPYEGWVVSRVCYGMEVTVKVFSSSVGVAWCETRADVTGVSNC